MNKCTIAFVLLFSTVLFSKNSPTKIIGDNDLLIVNSDVSNIPMRYKNIANAVAAVQFTESDADGKAIDTFYGCTGTHMGNGYVITAGHCVGANTTLTAQKDCSTITKNVMNSSSYSVTEFHFGYREGVAPFMKSKCLEIVAALKDDDTGYDFAILKVSPYPNEFVLPDTTRRSIIGDTVTIFSHPNGEVLQWSKTCGVERVQNPEIPGSFIQHQCDTKPGSSGAAIINALSLKIVGVHDGGMNNIDDATGMPLKTGMNYGTYILNSPLYDTLKSLGF
jgi:V8-like Glu-specific endopeptidase